MRRWILIISFALAGCGGASVTLPPPTNVAVNVFIAEQEATLAAGQLAEAQRSVAEAQQLAAEAQRAAFVATAGAQATLDTAARDGQVTMMAASAGSTAAAIAIQPILTLSAATATADSATQRADETSVAATPQAAANAALVAQSEADTKWQESLNRFADAVLVMCVGILLCATIVVVAVIAESRHFMNNAMTDARLLLEVGVNYWRWRAKAANIRELDSGVWTMPADDGSVDLQPLPPDGPVATDTGALTREWRLAVWRFCEAAAAVGTFAGDALEAAQVLQNDDEGWKSLTDVMARAGILVKRDRARTKYAPGWSLARVREEYQAETLTLPHPANKQPPAVKFAVGQMAESGS